MKRIVPLTLLLLTASGGGIAAQQVPAQALNDVGQLLVGDWVGEGVYAADYPGIGKKGEKFTSTFTCRWAAGRAAISCEGTDNQNTWVAQYWWDPGAKVVRSVAVNSGGNFDQGTIAKAGAKLVWSSAGAFSDGRPVEYKGETFFEDNGNTRIEAGATILSGVRRLEGVRRSVRHSRRVTSLDGGHDRSSDSATL